MQSTAAESGFVVGLTGGIGSGKTWVSDHLAQLGAKVVDTDIIAHQLTAPSGRAMSQILAAFGSAARQPDGSLNRAYMRDLVFSNTQAKSRLEAILHPLIGEQAMAEIAASSAPYVVLVVPLLVESGRWLARIDRVLVVDCDVGTQVERVMARSKLSRDATQAIVAQQATREQRLAAADDVIVNQGTLQQLATQVENLHRNYLERARAKPVHPTPRAG
jgi:dephospho-CoA kinase